MSAAKSHRFALAVRRRQYRAHLFDWLSREVQEREHREAGERYGLTEDQACAVAETLANDLYRKAVSIDVPSISEVPDA